MPRNLISLQEAVNRIKSSIETAIVSGGTTAKNNLIRSQQPVKLLHEVIKSELIRQDVNEQLIILCTAWFCAWIVMVKKPRFHLIFPTKQPR
jgi:hypothetical protein